MHVETDIIIRCKKYDKSAFVELFKVYEKYLYKLCYSYVQNEQDALDLAQEVYIKVFSGISGFNSKMPFHPWFRKVAVNTCLNYKRALKYDTVSLNAGSEDDKALEEMVAARTNVEAEALDNELGRLIRDNLNSLRPNIGWY